jgi:uncharacterized protein
MKGLELLSKIALVLVIIGGINWGLVGLFNINLVQAIFGVILARLIFIVVGIAAGYMIYEWLMKKKSI